jgi:hypothetical protein
MLVDLSSRLLDLLVRAAERLQEDQLHVEDLEAATP